MVNGEWSTVNGSLSQAAIGRALDLSPASVTKLKKQGMPVHSVEAAQAWRLARQNIAQRKPLPQSLPLAASAPHREQSSVAAREPMAALGESHDEARTRREIAEADLAELKLRELRGDLLRREVVERIVGEQAAKTREAVLQIKSRLAPLLAAESDALKVAAMLDAELRASLQKGVS
jgi:hypothetical protein